jgi:small GTP-binding protein
MLIDEGTLVFRVVLIGDSSVGKTCIVNRFRHNNFNSSEQNTIGASYETYSETRNGFQIELQIWDTAGQEKFKSLGPVYYRDAAAALAVFDLSNRSTLEGLDGWITNFRAIAGPDALVVVVGNKADLVDLQKVSEKEARQWCEDQGLDFLATSAKTGSGVAEVFDLVLTRLSQKQCDFATKGVPKFMPTPQLAPAEKKDCGC